MLPILTLVYPYLSILSCGLPLREEKGELLLFLCI